MSSEDEDTSKGKSPLPMCKYGDKCYRRNAQHLQQYRHPKRRNDEDDCSPQKKPRQETKKRTIGDFFKQDDKSSKKEEAESDGKNDPGNNKTGTDTCTSPTKSTHSDVIEEPETPESLSQESENESMPESPADMKENIKQKFLVDMPPDFYDFWEFCKSLSPEHPSEALQELLDFELVGPYDVLSGKHKGRSPGKKGKSPNYLCYWRYYYDPPEFLTVVRGDRKSQFHLGYYRDDPAEMPAFVAANSAKVNCTISPKGENLFAAIKFYIDEKLKDKSIEKSRKDKLKSLSEKVAEWAYKGDYSLDLKTKRMKERDKKVVCKTFHGAGIVVPVDTNDIGYRPVPESVADLKKMFKKIQESNDEDERNRYFEPLQELITLVQFANDECDYGEGLELGLDLFSYGGDCFHRTVMLLLPLAYQLLGRPQYGDVITAHLKNRRRDL